MMTVTRYARCLFHTQITMKMEIYVFRLFGSRFCFDNDHQAKTLSQHFVLHKKTYFTVYYLLKIFKQTCVTNFAKLFLLY